MAGGNEKLAGEGSSQRRRVFIERLQPEEAEGRSVVVVAVAVAMAVCNSWAWKEEE